MLPLLQDVREACDGHIAALPVPYRTTEAEPTFQSLTDPGCDLIPDGRPFPTALDPFTCNRYELAAFATAAAGRRCDVFRRVLWRRAAPHPQRRRSARADASGQPIHRRHEPSRVLRHRRSPEGGQPEVRQRAVILRLPAFALQPSDARRIRTPGATGDPGHGCAEPGRVVDERPGAVRARRRPAPVPAGRR